MPAVGVVFFFVYPSVPNPVGSILQITNAKEAGAQGMAWTYENQGGVIRGNRAYTNTLRVITNSPFVGPIQIQRALISIGAVQGAYYRFPLPEYNGDGLAPTVPTEMDTGSFLHSVTIAQETEDALQWKCTFEYGANDINHELGKTNQADGSANPLEKAPDVDWSGVIEEVSYPNDINGLPFVNVVGDPLENPPKRKESRQSLLFVRNEATYNDNYAQQYRQTVNQDAFLQFDAGQAKCAMITGKRIYSADYGYYWEVRYEFEFRVVTETIPDTYDLVTGLSNNDGSKKVFGFQDRVLNAGYRQLSGGKVTAILVNGAPVSSPVALDQNGAPLNIDVSVTAEQGPEPFFLEFNNYLPMDFNALQIPDDVLTANQ